MAYPPQATDGRRLGVLGDRPTRRRSNRFRDLSGLPDPAGRKVSLELLFMNFQNQLAGDNVSLASLPAGPNMVTDYHSARGQKIEFSCWGHESGSEFWGVFHVDNIPTHGLGAWPFAGGEWASSGPVLRPEVQTPMHGTGDGLIEITSPRLRSLGNPANPRVPQARFHQPRPSSDAGGELNMWRVIALGLALAFPTTAAHADAVVTLCNSGNQTGAGTNLVSALATGGRITFACGSSATILMSCQHQIVANTEIDGGGTVTLQDDPSACLIPRTQGLFNHNSAQPFSFQLTSLRIVGVKPPPQTPAGQLEGPARLWKLRADGGELNDNGLDLAHRSDRGTGDPGQQHALRQRRRCRRRTQPDDPQSLGLRQQRGPATGSSGRRSGDRRLLNSRATRGAATSNSVQR